MNRQSQPFCLMLAVLGAGLTLLTPTEVRADTLYRIQPIVTLGDKVGEIQIYSRGNFEVGALNDNGQIVFSAENGAEDAGDILFHYSDGKLTPIVVAGQNAPGGIWTKPVSIYGPLSMNQRGNVAFAVDITVGDVIAPGTFLWDFAAQSTSAVALRGMSAVGGLKFEAGGYYNPSINDSGEIAFPAFVNNAAGELQTGIFLLDRDKKSKSVILPDQELPGGGKVVFAVYPSLNEAGAVAFLVHRPDELYSAYRWEGGQTTPVMTVGADLPDGGKVASAGAALVNNQNKSVLLAVLPQGSSAFSLYRFADGRLTAVVIPGQAMPGGVTFRNLLYPTDAFPRTGISTANDQGQHAFLATVTEAGATRTAAFLLDPDGKLSLILKSGTSTDLGVITALGPPSAQPSSGVALNNKGQVVLPARIGSGPAALVLLTPVAP